MFLIVTPINMPSLDTYTTPFPPWCHDIFQFSKSLVPEIPENKTKAWSAVHWMPTVAPVSYSHVSKIDENIRFQKCFSLSVSL